MADVSGGLAVLKNRDLSLYISARFLSNIANQMLIVAVGWQVYQITGSVLDLGLIGLSQFLPFLCLVLISGHVADQYDRRIILLLGLCAYFACSVTLLCLALSNIRSTLPIFGVLAVYGVTRAFQLPAGQSFVPTIVEVGRLRNALAFSSSANQLASITGPGVGGVLYAVAETHMGRNSGASLEYATSAVLVMIAAVMMLLVRKRRAPTPRSQLSWDTLLLGIRFVWHRKTVLGAISLDLFAVLFGGAAALLPAYTRDVLHAGPAIFGYLRAAPGIGAGATALVLAFKPISRHVGPKMFAGVAVFGVATIVLGLTRHFWVAMIALVLLGVGDMVSVFVRGLLVQLETPDQIRGRVSAVNAVFLGASNELGEFESGTTAAWFGLVPAIILGGALTLTVTFLWARILFPRLWRMGSFELLEEYKSDATS